MKLGFTSKFEDLPAWKADAFMIVDNTINEQKLKEEKKASKRKR